MPDARDAPRLPGLQHWCSFLFTIAVMCLLASGQHLCQKESIGLLGRIIQRVDNSSDRMFLTPENLTETCYMDHLSCFHGELGALQQECETHKKILSGLLLRLTQIKMRLQRGGRRNPACTPCQQHPRRSVLIFLNSLLALLQLHCRKLAG